MSYVIHQVGAYFYVACSSCDDFYTPWMGCKFIAGLSPNINFASTHLYTWVERGTVMLSVLPKNTAQCLWSGLKRGSLNPPLSALTMRLLCFPHMGSSYDFHNLTL